jgi:MBG domain
MKTFGNSFLIAALTLVSAGIASGANDRLYVAAIQPNDVAPNTTTNYNLTVTNNILSGPSHFLRQVIVTVPSAFTITGAVTVQAPPAAPLPWIASVSGRTITVISGSTSDASVTAGQSITITIPAKAPALSASCPHSDTYQWGISASQVIGGGGSGNAYLLTPGTSNPVVKVGCDTFTNLNLAIDPVSIGTTDTSALLTLTATLTKVVGAGPVSGELIAFTVGGQPVTCISTPMTINGVATCSYHPLPNPLLTNGTYDCQATFAGDAVLGLGSSTSQTVKLSINSTATGLSVSPASGAYGGTVNLSAILTANGLALGGKTVSFFLGSNLVGTATTADGSGGTTTGLATLSNVSLTGIAPGTIDNFIKAVFAGDGMYSSANGDATLTVGLIQPAITWSNPADITYGTPLSGTQLNASASVPGTFAYTPAAGTVLNAGPSQTLSVAFTPADPLTYSTATASVSINVLKANQTITFTGAPATSVYNSTFVVTASASSGLPVVITPSGACSIAGSTVTMTSGTGTCVLTATQAGNGNYNPALPAVQSTTAAKAAQAVLAVTAPSSLTYGTTGTATASGGSGTGALSFVSTGTGCSVAGTTVSVINASGTCSLTATKAADSNFLSATSGAFPVTLNKAPVTVTFSNLTQPYTGSALSPTVNVPAGLTVVTTGFPDTNVGTYAVTATINDPNYYGSASDTFKINGAAQTITFSSITVTAAATSGGTVLYSSGTPNICSVTQVLGPDNVTPVAPGQATVTLLPGQNDWSLCKVQANQNGAGTNYNPAPQVTAFLTAQ